MLGTTHVLIVSVILFSMGVIGVLWRRGAITILMSVELMLGAANLAFIASARQHGQADGQLYALFVVMLAVAQAVVGLAIVVALARLRDSTDVDELNLLKW